jgi:hypothetical protein
MRGVPAALLLPVVVVVAVWCVLKGTRVVS